MSQAIEGARSGNGKIDHVFVIYLENQTFDRLFGTFPGADGDAKQKHIQRQRPWYMPWFQPTHGVLSYKLRRVWANVFFRGQFLEQDRPLWWRWARDFVLADRHRTHRGPSTPNHMDIIAGTSAGLENNPNPIALFRWIQTTPHAQQPPYNETTLQNRLEDAGISWANYGEVDLNFFTKLADPNRPGQARNSYPNYQFFDDMKNGKVASVTWLFPKNDVKQGDIPALEWTREVVEAIKTAPGDLWSRSAIFLTWDDWGGYYDHVQPVKGEAPKGFEQGGRVPLLIMSPYAKSGMVFHEPTIHLSIPRFIGKLFGLEPVTAIEAQANDLMNAFDFNQKPLPAPNTSPSLSPVPQVRTSFLRRMHTKLQRGFGLA